MVKSALEYKQFDWLRFVWAFGKNKINARRDPLSEKITYDMLF